MDWLETVNDPLIVVRAIHFTATAVTAGSMLCFSGLPWQSLHWVQWVRPPLLRGCKASVSHGSAWQLPRSQARSGFCWRPRP